MQGMNNKRKKESQMRRMLQIQYKESRKPPRKWLDLFSSILLCLPVHLLFSLSPESVPSLVLLMCLFYYSSLDFLLLFIPDAAASTFPISHHHRLFLLWLLPKISWLDLQLCLSSVVTKTLLEWRTWFTDYISMRQREERFLTAFLCLTPWVAKSSPTHTHFLTKGFTESEAMIEFSYSRISCSLFYSSLEFLLFRIFSSSSQTASIFRSTVRSRGYLADISYSRYLSCVFSRKKRSSLDVLKCTQGWLMSSSDRDDFE